MSRYTTDSRPRRGCRRAINSEKGENLLLPPPPHCWLQLFFSPLLGVFFSHFVFKHFCETADGRGEGFLIGAQPGRSPCLFYGFSLVRKMIFPCAHLFHASPETPPLRSGLRYSFFLPFFAFFAYLHSREVGFCQDFFLLFFLCNETFFSFFLFGGSPKRRWKLLRIWVKLVCAARATTNRKKGAQRVGGRDDHCSWDLHKNASFSSRVASLFVVFCNRERN